MVFETNFKIIHISILQIFVYILERVKKVLFEFGQEYKFENILYEILKDYEKNITIDMANAIATGIITDTGGFQYSSVTSDTFEFAAQLLRKGVNISKICQEVLRTKTKAHCQLEKLIY